MLFRVLFCISLVIFFLGFIYKVSSWFTRPLGRPLEGMTVFKRFLSFIKGFLKTVFSGKVVFLIRSFILDVLLQTRILREDFLRWLMHMLIYGGFMLLLLMHGLGEIITSSLFRDYSSTLNPFFFLRDLFGVMVIGGLVIAFFRRKILKVPRLRTRIMDGYSIIILGVIMLSGFILEGDKITSNNIFREMIEEYSDVDIEDTEEVRALASLWVKEFGLVSPGVEGPFEEDILEQGMEIHEMNCAGCHSRPQWAFGSYLVSVVLRPGALILDRSGVHNILYYIHILACFIGLAYLPFSKMFHIISTPLSLLANSVMDREGSDPLNIITRQLLELDACTHCCTCSLYCSAMMAEKALGNDLILPSEKMVYLKSFLSGKDPGEKGLSAIQEGVYLCTNCDRCTVVCPSGINLKDLWIRMREVIFEKRVPEPLMLSSLSLVRGLNSKEMIPDDYLSPLMIARNAVKGRFDDLIDPERPVIFPVQRDEGGLEIKDNTFSYCFGCTNCTNVCPVVNSYDRPQDVLGLLPHQIMCCLGLGLDEMASGPDMIWDCVTCYQCQEHCPQGVKVTDVLYDLKNEAVRRVKSDNEHMMKDI